MVLLMSKEDAYDAGDRMRLWCFVHTDCSPTRAAYLVAMPLWCIEEATFVGMINRNTKASVSHEALKAGQFVLSPAFTVTRLRCQSVHSVVQDACLNLFRYFIRNLKLIIINF